MEAPPSFVCSSQLSCQVTVQGTNTNSVVRDTGNSGWGGRCWQSIDRFGQNLGFWHTNTGTFSQEQPRLCARPCQAYRRRPATSSSGPDHIPNTRTSPPIVSPLDGSLLSPELSKPYYRDTHRWSVSTETTAYTCKCRHYHRHSRPTVGDNQL